MFEEIVDVAKLFSLDAYQVMEEIVEVFELIPQERVKQCTAKQTDNQNTQQVQDNEQQLARHAARQERGEGMKGRSKIRLGETERGE